MPWVWVYLGQIWALKVGGGSWMGAESLILPGSHLEGCRKTPTAQEQSRAGTGGKGTVGRQARWPQPSPMLLRRDMCCACIRPS